MKQRVAMLAVPLLLVGAAGCASVGTPMDPAVLARIKPGVTTEAEMLQWFGSPKSKTLDTTGNLVLTWYYIRVSSSMKQQVLSVLFNPDGIVEKYTLIDDINGLESLPGGDAGAGG